MTELTMHFIHGTQNAVEERLLQLKMKLQEQCSEAKWQFSLNSFAVLRLRSSLILLAPYAMRG